MKTKEEILEHLETTKYDCIYNICGWLVGKGLKDTKEAVIFLTNGDRMYNFDDFLAWVNEENKKKDKDIKLGDIKDGCISGPFYLDTGNLLTRKKITPMDFLETLSRIFPEEVEDEPAYKADYIVLYNNTEYEIIADSVATKLDGIVFIKGEEKVAYFPVNTPWIKI